MMHPAEHLKNTTILEAINEQFDGRAKIKYFEFKYMNKDLLKLDVYSEFGRIVLMYDPGKDVVESLEVKYG